MKRLKRIDLGQIFSKIKIPKIKIPKIKIKIGEIAVVLVVLVLAGLVIVPSVVQCVANNNKSKCNRHMSAMITTLSDMLAEEEKTGNTYCHDLIKNGNYQKLISVVNEKTGSGNEFPSAEYYIMPGDETLTLMCKTHLSITNKTVKFSLMKEVNNVEIAPKPLIGEKILYVTVSGPDTYYEDESIDAANPEKKVFVGREIDDVINNLTVTAVYAGGAREEIERSNYTITAKKLDLSKAGQTVLWIKSNSRSLWDNSVRASFIIDVVGNNDIAPLIVDGGLEGRFELAAWDWSDFVEEAGQENGGKEFGASIVRYNGMYYYYPDGFTIKNDNKNSTPFKFALDKDDEEKAAYNICFNKNTAVDKDADEKTLKAGDVKVENELIYIWQTEKSKEADPGWLRVYCDLTKY